MRYLMNRFVAFLILGLLSCRRPPPTVQEPTPKPATSPTPAPRELLPLSSTVAILYVDPDFSDEEKRDISAACYAWYIFTGKRIRISLVDGRPLNRAMPAHRILKIDSSAWSVQLIDAKLAHGKYKTAAFTYISTIDQNAPRLIYVISDRIGREELMWTVAHEIGHLLGLGDLATRGSVMSGEVDDRTTGFTDSDRQECLSGGVCVLD